jgi:microsomal epoxide hydrolase
MLVNFSMTWKEPEGVDQKDVNEEERAGLQRMLKWMTHGSAYTTEHRTRPATIGFALSASPLALLAWYKKREISNLTSSHCSEVLN